MKITEKLEELHLDDYEEGSPLEDIIDKLRLHCLNYSSYEKLTLRIEYNWLYERDILAIYGTREETRKEKLERDRKEINYTRN